MQRAAPTDAPAAKTTTSVHRNTRRDAAGGFMPEPSHRIDRFEGPVRDAGLPLVLDESLTCRVPGRATPVQFLGIAWGELRRGYEIGRRGDEARRRFRMPAAAAWAVSIQRLLALRQAAEFQVLLAHTPHAFDRSADAARHRV